MHILIYRPDFGEKLDQTVGPYLVAVEQTLIEILGFIGTVNIEFKTVFILYLNMFTKKKLYFLSLLAGGASNDKCFDTYHGPEAFSEVEAQAARDYILQLNGTIQYYNSQHSYSQLILLPWAWTSEPPDNSFELV